MSKSKRKLEPFVAKQEAAQIRENIQNYADKETMEGVLERLSNMKWPQRLETCREYRELAGRDLLQELQASSEPSLHVFIKELLTDRILADVQELSLYFQNVNSYYRELVEFFCLRTNIALAIVSTEYNKSQDISIAEELGEVDDEAVKTLLLGICKGEFNENGYAPNETNIRKDALLLAKAPKTTRWTSRDGKLHQLLQSRSHAYIRDVIYDFEEVTGENFLDAIEAECSHAFLGCMETFDFVISSTQHVFAKKLMQCFLDGNVEELVRIFVNVIEQANVAEIVSYYNDKYERDFFDDLGSVVELPLFDVMKRVVAGRQKDVPKKTPTENGATLKPGKLTQNGTLTAPFSRPSGSSSQNSSNGNDHGSDREGSGHPNKYKFFTHGTVSPLKTFDPYRDIHDFRIAMQHYATNDLPLIYLISSKTNHQRQVLKSVYTEVFDAVLIDDVMETVGDELDYFMAALLLRPDEFDATFLHELIETGNETSFALLEILCSKTVKELKAIDQQYKKKYGVRLSADLAKQLTRNIDVVLLLCELAEAKRVVGWNVDRMAAETDAREMYQQFYRDSPDIDYFVQTLTARSREQLRETFRTFRKFAGIDVLTALEPLFSTEFAEALRLLVLCVEDRVSFFAYCLNEYIQNNDVRNLIRLIVSRSEIDLVEIKAAYQGFYNITLLDDLRPLLDNKPFRLMSGIVLDK
ncbi:annexin A6-like [Paramacrobiotus metropolitanus]|uniref:annexin A6-like n=1 Tax=Paramacrobiotus metropolitanus TaxID=2943436 RepID=UPI0024464697|nr:annexin A6-like [Paramacrobiotus metropolitanus]XP_055347524.1 annexin A6-like [Paramacrobiotus metropolitanus]